MVLIVPDICLLFCFFKDFIYLSDSEREITSRQREGGSRLSLEQRARYGTRSQDPEIVT